MEETIKMYISPDHRFFISYIDHFDNSFDFEWCKTEQDVKQKAMELSEDSEIEIINVIEVEKYRKIDWK